MSAITRLTDTYQVRMIIKQINLAKEPQALDIETTGLDPRKDLLLTIGITYNDTAYLFSAEFANELENLTVGLILHNFKFDYAFLYSKGINLLDHDFRDTMLMHHLLNEEASHSLDSIVKELYNTDYKEVFWNTYKTFQDAPESAQDEYAGKDILYTLKLYHDLLKALKEALIPDNLIKQVHRFARALLDTEILGVNLDLKVVKDRGIETLRKISLLDEEMRFKCNKEINSIEEEIYQVELSKRKTDKGKAGVQRPHFNFDSNKQLQSLIYDKLRLPVQLSPQRKPIIDDNALSKLEGEHEFIKLLRDYRENQKLFTAFLEAAIDKAYQGRIYPSFNINGTVTGRISASNPNLQQLPRSGNIRSMYVPSAGYSFISADYSQLEVSLAAHYSGDANLLRVVYDNVSLHDITAEGLGIDRGTAKTVNFAIQYGAGVGKLQKIFKCSKEQAEEALKKYWETYPELKVLVDKCHSCCDQGIAITNPFGRQRHLSTVGLTDKWEIAAIKRQAFNSLIQGTGADITNKAFTLISEELVNSGDGRALFPIHDEILIEVLDSRVDYWNNRIKEIMEGVPKEINLTVPLKAEVSGGMKCWQD